MAVPLQNTVTDVVLADGTILVAQSLDPWTDEQWIGIRAFDRNGNEQWKKQLGSDVRTIAAVEKALFVGDSAGRVIALA